MEKQVGEKKPMTTNHYKGQHLLKRVESALLRHFRIVEQPPTPQQLQQSSTSASDSGGVNDPNNNNNTSTRSGSPASLLMLKSVDDITQLLDEACDHIGPSTPLPIRLELLTEFCKVIKGHRLESEVNKLWKNVSDLFEDSKPVEAKLVGLHVMSAIIGCKGVDNLGVLSLEFFRILQTVDAVPVSLKLDTLRLLTNNGRNTSTVKSSRELISLVVSWLTSSHVMHNKLLCLDYLIDVTKYSFTSLTEETVIYIIDLVALLCNPSLSSTSSTTNTASAAVRNSMSSGSSSNNNETVILSDSEIIIKRCLTLFDVIIRYGCVPPSGLVKFCTVLCRTVNEKNICDESWETMNNFLNSRVGHRAFQALCGSILSSKATSCEVDLYRGAIFFVGMSTWGSKRIKSLEASFCVALSAMLNVLKYNEEILAYEVLLSVRRLVKKYGSTLLRAEWDFIIEILRHLDIYVSKDKNSSLDAALKQTLSYLEALYHESVYFGDEAEFFKLMELYKDLRPESSAIMILQYKAERLHPAHDHWLTELENMFKTYFEKETRPVVKEKVLEVFETLLSNCKNLYGDSILEVALPFLQRIYREPDPSICKKGASIIVTAAQVNPFTQKFEELLDTLDKIIMYSTPEVQHLAVVGLVNTFEMKFSHLPCSDASYAYLYLVKHVAHENRKVRKAALKCLLRLRANHLYQLQLGDKVSPYLLCHQKYYNISYTRSVSLVLSIPTLIEALLSRLQTETDFKLFMMTLRGLKDMILNKYLMKQAAEGRISDVLCSVFTERFKFMVDGSLRNTSTKLAQYNCIELVIQVLNSFVGVKHALHGEQRANLLRCIVFILSQIPKLPSQIMTQNQFVFCLHALGCCIFEIPIEMNSSLQDIFAALLEVTNTPFEFNEFKVAVLQFLHSLVSHSRDLPEAILMKILVFILPLTDTNEVDNGFFIANLATRVLVTMFSQVHPKMRPKLLQLCLPVLTRNVREQHCTLSETAIDFLARYSFLSGFDASPSAPGSNTYDEYVYANGHSRTWIMGNSIITAQSGKFGHTRLTFRRPTGTTEWRMKLANESLGPQTDVLQSLLYQLPVDQVQFDGMNDSVELKQLPTVAENSNNNNNNNNFKLPNILSLLQSPLTPLDKPQPPLQGHASALPVPPNSLPVTIPVTITDTRQPTSLVASERFTAEDYFGMPISTPTMSTQQHSRREEEQSTSRDSIDTLKIATGANNRKLSPVTSFYHPLPSYDEDEFTSPPFFNSAMSARELLGTSSESNDQDQDSSDSNTVTEEQHSESHHQDESGTLQTTIGELDVMPTQQPSDANVAPAPASPLTRAPPITEVPGDDANTSPRLVTQSSPPPLPSDDKGACTTQASQVSPDFDPTRRKEPRKPSFSTLLVSREKSQHQIDVPTATVLSSNVDTNNNNNSNQKGSPSLSSVKPSGSPTMLTLKHSSFKLKYRPLQQTHSQQQQKPDVKKPPELQNQNKQTGSVLLPGEINPNFPYLFFRSWPFSDSTDEPKGLRNSESITRALSLLDRTPNYETHKIGVIYVGEGQTTEEEILANTSGGTRYFEFLRRLGSFVSIREQASNSNSGGTMLYTGGLDRSEECIDGEYMLTHQDHFSRTVFHVATMIPNLPHDPKFDNKKRHIGNDYVNIVYSCSPEPYKQDTIMGEFNFVHIIIHPLDDGLNRVEVKQKDFLPRFGPLYSMTTSNSSSFNSNTTTTFTTTAATGTSSPTTSSSSSSSSATTATTTTTQQQQQQQHAFLVSDDALADVVRITALHADLTAEAWRQGKGEQVSNWQERLRQIRLIKERFAAEHSTELEELFDYDGGVSSSSSAASGSGSPGSHHHYHHPRTSSK